MRLIDADALQLALHKLPRDSQQAELYHASVMAAVKAAPTVCGWHDAHTDPPTDSDYYVTWCSDLEGEGYNFFRYNAYKKEWNYWGEMDYWLKMPDPPEVRQ